MIRRLKRAQKRRDKRVNQQMRPHMGRILRGIRVLGERMKEWTDRLKSLHP